MDAGHRNNIDGGQGQLRREEKEHKPMLSKVKEKVGKLKHTLTGGGRSQAGRGHGVDEPRSDDGKEVEGNTSLDREAAMEKAGYTEDKPVGMEPDPEVHGAPMYESERAPAVQDLVAKYDQQAREPQGADAAGGHAVRDPAPHDSRRHDDSPEVRLGDLGGPVVEDPAAPRSTTPAAREGEDIGTTPVVKEFESMTLSEDTAHVGAAKQGARAEDGKDAADDKVGGATYTDKLKNVAAVPADYGSKLATTAHAKITGGGTAEGTGKRDEERVDPLPLSDAGAGGAAGVGTDTDRSYGTQLASDEARPESDVGAQETNEAVAVGGATYTDKLKNLAAVPAEYGSKLATTAREKVVGGGTAQGMGKRDEKRAEPVPVSDAGATEEARPLSDISTDERKESEATDKTGAATYTDKIKNVATVPTVYGTKLVSTVRQKVTGGGTAEDMGKCDEERAEPAQEARPLSDIGTDERKESEASDTTGAATYTDKLKNAATVPTEYGTKLVSTVRQKVIGGGIAEDTEKRDEERAKPALGSDAGAAEEARPLSDTGTDEKQESEATDKQMGATTYTDKLKNVATVPAEYGTKLVSTVREKVTGGATAAGSEKRDDERTVALPESEVGAGGEGVDTASNRSSTPDVGAEERTEAATTDSASGPGNTEKVKSATAGTTEYGKQLASTAYEKAAGIGSAVVGKVQQAKPSSTPQQDTTNKEEAGGGRRVPAPSQVVTKAREAVTSLTGGSRVSETEQPNAATGADIGEEQGGRGTSAPRRGDW